MKILYTLNSGNPGGMEQHVLDLVNQMILRNHEVYVWCNEGIIYDWYIRAGAKVTGRVIRNDIDISYIKDLKNFLKQNQIDVVHAHELKAVANSVIAAFLAGTKVRISHQHTPFSDWQVPKSKRLIYDIFYALLINMFGTREIALTNSVKKIKENAGISKKKLVVIPNGIDTYKFFVTPVERENYRREICRKYHIDPASIVLGNISRTTCEKGQDILLKAFSRLLSSNETGDSKYTLLICGGGELEETLWKLAGSLGIKDRLVITGKFDDEMKLKFYNTFDYFIFPSLGEGFGIVLIEALMSGLPVVSSDLPVLKEVGADFPLFFKTGSVDSLYDVLLKRIENPINVEDREHQQKYIEKHFSLDKFGQNYSTLYESLLKP